jgi:hypothetical protein
MVICTSTWVWPTLWIMQLVKAAVGRGKVFHNRLWIPILELNNSLPIRLTVASPVLMQVQRSSPASLEAESAATAPTGKLPSISSPWGSDLCHAQRNFLRRSQWQMVILQIRHRGGWWYELNLTQLAGHRGLCTALPDDGQHYKPCLLQTGSNPGFLVI